MKLTSFGFSISGYSRVLFHFANCEIVELTIKIYANSLKNVEKEGLFSRKTKNGYSGFAKYRILNFRSRALKSNSRPFSKKKRNKKFQKFWRVWVKMNLFIRIVGWPLFTNWEWQETRGSILQKLVNSRWLICWRCGIWWRCGIPYRFRSSQPVDKQAMA